MSEEVNKEQTKGAKQEKITELSEEQLEEAAGGGRGADVCIGTENDPAADSWGGIRPTHG